LNTHYHHELPDYYCSALLLLLTDVRRLTEFGWELGTDHGSYQSTTCVGNVLLENRFGAVHGAFHAGRIMAAINTQIGCTGAGCGFAVVTFETFVFRDPAPTNFPQDFCGMPAGTVADCAGSGSQGQPTDQCVRKSRNRPDLARVTGTGQLVAHLSARALAMETMHPVNVTGTPTLKFPADPDQPCIQAAAFRTSASRSSVFAIMNICNMSVAMTLPSDAGTAVVYSLLDTGGKAPLPVNPQKFPWAGPLNATLTQVTSQGVYTAPRLSFAVVEVQATQLDSSYMYR
jgi:hypothetical protein